MRISNELHQAIVSTTNQLLDTSYTPQEIRIAFDARMEGYFDLYKRNKARYMLVASTSCGVVRTANKEMSDEITQVLTTARHGQFLYSED